MFATKKMHLPTGKLYASNKGNKSAVDCSWFLLNVRFPLLPRGNRW